MIQQPAAPSPESAKAGQRRWRNATRWALTVVLLTLLFVFVDFRSAVTAVSDANIPLLVAGLFVNFLATIFIPSVITQFAMSAQDRQLGIPRLVEINLTNRFYVLVLPRAASLAIRWHRYGEGAMSAHALALMMFERGVQLAALLVLSFWALWIDRAALGLWVTPFLTLVGGGTAAILMLMLPFTSETVERMLRKAVAFVTKFLPRGLTSKFERLIGSAAVFRSLPRSLSLSIIALSLIATVLFFCSAWLAALAIGLDIPLISLVWIRSLVFLMTLIPITIGGIGVREVGFVGLLGMIGIPGASALAFSAINFAFQAALALAGALIECWRLVIAPRTLNQRPDPLRK